MLATDRWVRAMVPPIPADAHKGTRKKLVIIGGQVGMAGAPMLAARAAMRSGIGMVRLVVARENLPVVQESTPHALARAWPGESAGEINDTVGSWADGVLIGPGLGNTPESRALVERVLHAWRGPVVVDADALNVFKGEASTLGALLAGRPALLTPHPVEFSRLANVGTDEVLARRYDIGVELARTTHAAVLLKGVPTVVSDPTGTRRVSAAGTPALAAAGSGDLLAGIAATLLAQLGDPLAAGACAAWVHGRAAELAEGGRGPRGVALEDVEHAIARVWSANVAPATYPALADLPAVGDRTL
jgi:NAD(P)H-hydrate epimerase